MSVAQTFYPMDSPPQLTKVILKQDLSVLAYYSFQGGDSIDILGKKLGKKLSTILGRVPECILISAPAAIL